MWVKEIIALAICSIPVFAQNPSPCLNIVNTAGAGQVLSAVNGGSTSPPCKWINNGGGGGGGGTVTHINTTLPIQGGPITTTGTISCRTATGSVSGCLSAADWTTFNAKGSGTITSLTATGPIVVTPSPLTTTGVISCPTCASAFLDQQGPTGNIAMTGSDVTMFTTTIAGATMGAGKCLSMTLWYLTNDGGAITDFKIFYGATSYTFRAGVTATEQEMFPIIRLCNDAGVTNAQTLYLGFMNFTGAQVFAPNGMVPVTGVFTTDSTASQTFKVTGNAASGNVVGEQYHLEVDR